MSLVEDFRASRDKAQVAFTEFMLHTRQGKDGLFCFFEGERGSDNPYYVPRIKQFTDKYYPIRCGGRERVLKVHELISRHVEYEKYKKAFFIDKDFNPEQNLTTPPIYETPCYSIENLYVSLDTFKEIIINFFSISEVDENFDLCVKTFKDRQKEYHIATALFNAWYACLIDIRNSTRQQTGVNLDDKLPKGFISFTLNRIESNYDINTIRALYPTAPNVDDVTLQDKINLFETSVCHEVFRGKFELNFVLFLIQLIINDSLNEQQLIKKKIKFSFSDRISNDQALGIFSPYAKTPPTLTCYLQQVCI